MPLSRHRRRGGTSRRHRPRRNLAAYLRSYLGTDETGRPNLEWHFNEAVLAEVAATDGWYALVTNLDPGEADAIEALCRYKGQEVVERRYGDFKGPLAVHPCI